MQDLTNLIFGHWKVLSFGYKDDHHMPMWICQCDCGRVKNVNEYSLLSGRSTSCGRHTNRRKEIENIPYDIIKQLRGIYYGIKQRCYDINADNYKYYGGKGIRMCDEWVADIKTFIIWAYNNGYKEGLTIDRINIDKNYSPINCQWITQSQNTIKRNNKNIEIDGMIKSYSEWSIFLGYNKQYISRYKEKHNLTENELKDFVILKYNEYLINKGN